MLVVKVGGSAGIDYDAFCDDAATIVTSGRPLILIHGGSSRMDAVATALGHKPEFVTSPSGIVSRWTDRQAMTIFEMVYCGEMNKGIVERLQARGVNAVGLCGMDGRIWVGPRKSAIESVENGVRRIRRGGLTGRVDHVNTELLGVLLDRGMTPVLTPPALSDDGLAINVDGDRAAAKTAAAVSADTLVILSNVPGLLANREDLTSRIARIDAAELDQAANTYAQGRMRIKLLAAGEALRSGVSRVAIGGALGPRPIQRALEGDATMITTAVR